VGLHVDVLAAEDLLGTIAGEVLNDVSVLAAAVVATAGVALGVFVGENGAGCLQHCFRNEVLTGNHLEALVLAEGFVIKSGGDVGVGLGEGERHAVSHTGILRHSGKRKSLNKLEDGTKLLIGVKPVLMALSLSVAGGGEGLDSDWRGARGSGLAIFLLTFYRWMAHGSC